MVNNSNTYEHETCGSSIAFNWRQPLQLLRWFLYLIKNPSGAARQIAASEVIAQPLVIITVNIIAVFIASIVCAAVINARHFYLSWVHIPLAGTAVISALMAAVFDFGLAGLLFVNTGIIFRQKTTFARMLSIVSGKVAIDSLFILAGTVFMLINTLFFFLFAITGNIISFTLIITLYNEETELPPPKKLYGFSLPLAIVFVILLVLLKAVSSFSVSGMSYIGW